MRDSFLPPSFNGPILAALRIITGLIFLQHGTTKFFHFPYVEQFAGPLTLFSLLWFSAFLELIGGIMLVLGLFTSITAFIMSGFMAVAYFMFHSTRSFYPILNGGELAIMLCFVCLYLSATGAGPFSLDHARHNKK